MVNNIIKLLKTYDKPQEWGKNISWRFPSTISNLNSIFLVGCPRSGTTLLQRILCVHSELFSIEGETGLFSYQNIFDLKRKHFGLSQIEIKRILDQSIDIVDFFSKGVECLSTENEAQRFVEKTPQHILKLPFILKHFPKASIIHIVRDGRDCYCSSKLHPRIPQNKSLKNFAHYWKKCVNIPIIYQEDKRILTISYEKLVSHPSQTLLKIMNFLDLSVEENQLNSSYLADDRRAKLQQFNRLKEPINSSSVGRWKNELSEDQIKEFQQIAKKELQYYGY